MINDDKELIQALKNVRLSEAARTRMRAELSSYADMHAMPSGNSRGFDVVGFVMAAVMRSRPILAGALAIVIVASMGGTAVLAAEQSVPGDALYPVKVHINEPVAAVFAGSGEAQARYHSQLAVRRVEEAETLAKRGKLSVAVAQDLSVRFADETAKAVAAADKLESSGDVSASIAVRAELADDLSSHVARAMDTVALAPAPEAARTTKSAKMAKTAAVMEVPTAAPADAAAVFRSTVAMTIAHLDETRGKAEGVIAEKAENTPDGQDTADVSGTSIARGREAETPRALLAGASLRTASIASTTASSTDASSTPPFGRAFFKKLIKDHADSPAETVSAPEHTPTGRG